MRELGSKRGGACRYGQELLLSFRGLPHKKEHRYLENIGKRLDFLR